MEEKSFLEEIVIVDQIEASIKILETYNHQLKNKFNVTDEMREDIFLNLAIIDNAENSDYSEKLIPLGYLRDYLDNETI